GLAATHGLPVLGMQELREAAPEFELLPFNECVQHGCLLLRGGDGLLFLATDDPFSLDNHAWAEERLAVPFAWAIVHRADLQAFLASHEETLRALDQVQAASGPGADERGARAEDLSLKAISGEPSE